MTDASIMGAFDDWDAKELCWICNAPRNGRLNTCCDEHEALFEESMQGPPVARKVIPTSEEARARVAEVLEGRVGPSTATSGEAYALYLDPVKAAYEAIQGPDPWDS